MPVTFAKDCVFCNAPSQRGQPSESGAYPYSCPRCGNYLCAPTLEAALSAEGRPKNWEAISHRVRTGKHPVITTYYFDDFLRDAVAPAPMTTVENLITYIGHGTQFGTDLAPAVPELAAEIGTSDEALEIAAEYARSQGWVDFSRTLGGVNGLQLTVPGWSRFDELQTASTQSRLAFMAMKFNEPEVHAVYQNHFREAVKQTGFDLETVEVNQPAGLIDDHLRVKIRRSRFLIADVTHGNNGAYWEAGFAEGLGRPVIYTCSAVVMDDKKHPHHPHFDTNHHLIVKWDPADMGPACKKLKDTIRASLPDVANLEDQ